MGRTRLAVLAFAGLAALVTGAAASATEESVAGGAQAQRAQSGGLPPLPSSCRVPRSALSAGSRAVGRPSRGRLVDGVQFPDETEYAFTWEFPTETTPSPGWRRWGTEKLVLTAQCVLAAYGDRHPERARVGVADLSRPRGGSFGRRYAGGLGHASHQNGLDVDILDPRWDLCECPAEGWADVDYEATQELIDAFVRAGAEYIFVSPSLYSRRLLHGPRGVVIPLRFHDTHLHVRIRP
jgi:Penicillin-insensitive murein endopeptidase